MKGSGTTDGERGTGAIQMTPMVNFATVLRQSRVKRADAGVRHGNETNQAINRLPKDGYFTLFTAEM
jgi:hypothetical protein